MKLFQPNVAQFIPWISSSTSLDAQQLVALPIPKPVALGLTCSAVVIMQGTK